MIELSYSLDKNSYHLHSLIITFSWDMASFRRRELEHLYKTEADPDVKERLLLLVLKVEGDDEMIPSRTGVEHGPQTGCLPGIKKKVEGLKDRQTDIKAGDHPKYL